MKRYYRYRIIHKVTKQVFNVVATSAHEAIDTLGYADGFCFVQRVEPSMPPEQLGLKIHHRES